MCVCVYTYVSGSLIVCVPCEVLFLCTGHAINVFRDMRRSGYRKSTDTCLGVTNVMCVRV